LLIQSKINRTPKTGNFTQVDNAVIHDTSISVGARLVMIHMLSKRNGWIFYVSAIAKELGINKDTVAKYLKELIRAGYVSRMIIRDNGKFAGYQYIVNEQPIQTAQEAVQGTEAAEVVHTPSKRTAGHTEQSATVSENTVSGEISTTNMNNNKTILKHRKDVKEPSIESKQLDSSFVPENVPTEFVKAMQPFFNAEIIFKLWGKVLLAYNYMGQIHPDTDIAIRAAKQMIFLLKNNKLRKDMYAYMYGTVCGMIGVSMRRHITAPNWLEETE
jgi:DNA-binding IscR family transcriptional regulator